MIIWQNTNYFQTIWVSCIDGCRWIFIPLSSPGITFSFFWKNQEVESRFAVSSGGKVISNGFSVYTNPIGGYVEFYTRGNNHRWKANIKVPGIADEFAFASVLLVTVFPISTHEECILVSEIYMFLASTVNCYVIAFMVWLTETRRSRRQLIWQVEDTFLKSFAVSQNIQLL